MLSADNICLMCDCVYIWYYRSVGDVNEYLIQTLFSKEQGDNDSTESNDIHIWNEVLASPMFQNKPLLPNEECIIDFSTLELGTRVGRGKDLDMGLLAL